MKVATPEDFDAVHSMCLKFMEASGYSAFTDPDVLKDVIAHYLSADPTGYIVLLDDNGFIAGSTQRFPFGKVKIAAETAWWVNEEARKTGVGKELMGAFEYWAKNVAGCDMVVMTSLDEGVEKIYKKNGYKLYERAYMKVI